jgi:hypothetical protein
MEMRPALASVAGLITSSVREESTGSTHAPLM